MLVLIRNAAAVSVIPSRQPDDTSEAGYGELLLAVGTETANSVPLTWSGGPTSAEYRVYRGTGGVLFLLTTVTGPAHTDTTVLANTPYEYLVAELNAEGKEVSYSQLAGALTPQAQAPDPDPIPGDTTPPTDPTLSVLPDNGDGTVGFLGQGGAQVQVLIGESTDAGGMSRYVVQRDGQFLLELLPADFFAGFASRILGAGDGLLPGGTYTLTVTAFDLANNASEVAGQVFTLVAPEQAFTATTLGTLAANAAVLPNTVANATLSVAGSGIGGAACSGGFAYRSAPADTDFTISARLASLTGGSTHAGIAIRESVAPGAVMAAITVAATGATLRVRRTAGVAETGISIAATPPVWVRLERTGDVVQAYTSADGSAWTLRASVAMAFVGTPLVGYVAASREGSTARSALFESWSANLLPADTTGPTTPTLTTTVLGTNSVRLDWTASTDLRSGVREYNLTRNTVPIATVPFGTNTYTDTGLTAGTTYTYGVTAVDGVGNPSGEDTEPATTTALASNLGDWPVPPPEVLINQGFTGTIDIPITGFVPPPGYEDDAAYTQSAVNEAGAAVTEQNPTGVDAAIVGGNTIRLTCTNAQLGGTNPSAGFHVTPSISLITGGGEGTLGADASWATRAAGRIYVNNFSQYGTSAELSAAGAGATRPPASHGEALLYTGGDGPAPLSGGKCLELRTYDLALQNGGNFQITLPTRLNGFYAQIHVAMNRAARDWVRNGGDGNHGAKFVVFNQEPQAGVGQIALYNPKYLGFPGVFVDSFNGVERRIAAAGGKAQDWFYCTAIDNGGAESTNLEQITRYGPSRYIESVLNPRPWNGTNAAANYVDGRSFTHPHPNAIASGVPEFPIDDWLVIQVYINVDPVGGNDVIKMWTAHRGDAPKLVFQLGPALSGAGVYTRNSVGGSANGYNQIIFMNYPTNALAEPGYRPQLKVRYAEVIVDDAWIGFPGHEASPEP
jgi:regulation of enolase protein 1 (concanavalin A-like superfamily)